MVTVNQIGSFLLGRAAKTGSKLSLFDQDLTLILVNFLQDQISTLRIFSLFYRYMLLFIYIGFLRDDTNTLTSEHHFAMSRSKMSSLQSNFTANYQGAN